MVLKDIAMLAISNNRSKMYINKLLEGGYKPAYVLLLLDETKLTPGQRADDQGDEFIKLLVDSGISYEIFNGVNVNAPEVVSKIECRPEKYVIYSGPGGTIVRQAMLDTGKQFIHIHPGKLPEYRGSTTVYYQILDHDECGVSAIFFEKKIDAGPVLATKTFPVYKGMDLDYEYDPLIRAELLLELINEYVRRGVFQTLPQNLPGGETYFIMHPVLRHIARLKVS